MKPSAKPRRIPLTAARKTPIQSRSTQLVADILQAAVRVLAREGAPRFTTVRVAHEAGVSVGSLYQYFPNKEAILFRLQLDEWKQTSALLQRLLGDRQRTPHERLREVVRAFFVSECDEAELRVALGDAAPLYRDAPEIAAQRRAGMRRVMRFMVEALPGVSAKQRAFAADVVLTSISALGKQISERGRTRKQVEAWSHAVGDMLCAYLEQLARGARSGGASQAD